MSASSDTNRIPLSRPVLLGGEQEMMRECLESGWVSTAGPYVERFENEIAAYTGVTHAVSTNTGTAALHVIARVLGVRPEDEILLPTLTFIASANSVAYLGATPLLMDCDEYLNIDVDKVAAFLAEACEPGPDGVRNRATGRRIGAIMAVHVFGAPCDMMSLQEISRQYGIPLIEDAAEALGSRWNEGPLAGRHAGTVSALGALSFNGNKVITTGGGGMILTDDGKLAQRARHLTTTAKSDPLRFEHDEIGYNYRLTSLSAAFGSAQLANLERVLKAKHRNRQSYVDLLGGVDGLRFIEDPPGTDPNHWFYALEIDEDLFGSDRDEVMARLGENGIECRPVWQPIHLQAAYRGTQAYRIERAETYWRRIINLPCSADLSEEDVQRVAHALLACRK